MNPPDKFGTCSGLIGLAQPFRIDALCPTMTLTIRRA